MKRVRIWFPGAAAVLVALSSALFVFGVPRRASAAGRGNDASGQPVLVELFTSEGCSSCPPADALLAQLEREQPVSGAEIIVLGEHVDYWDSLGWKDRFSSHQLTQRQAEYRVRLRLDSAYTPQMIVDGKDEFVGNDTGHALRSIAAAAAAPKMPLHLSSVSYSPGRLGGTVYSPAYEPSLRGDLYAAIVQDTATTAVQRGENGGRTLRHVAVVRSLRRVGSLEDLSRGPLSFTLEAPSGLLPSEIRLVVFVQAPLLGQIRGAVEASVTGEAQRSSEQALSRR